MTEEERRIITEYVTRVSGAQAQAPRPSSPWGSSVPATGAAAALPPVDPEADRLLGELFTRYPEARYRLTQTAFVQEAALVQAQNRLQELEWELENTRRQAEANQGQSRGGLFGGMFGGGRQAQPQMLPRPQPMQGPGGYGAQQFAQQGGRGGSGFLGSALTTAAGVAGGLVLGNALMGMFSHGGAAAAASTVADTGAAAAGGFGQEQVATPTSSPWTDPGGSDATPTQDAGWGQDDAQADYGATDDAGYDEDV